MVHFVSFKLETDGIFYEKLASVEVLYRGSAKMFFKKNLKYRLENAFDSLFFNEVASSKPTDLSRRDSANELHFSEHLYRITLSGCF